MKLAVEPGFQLARGENGFAQPVPCPTTGYYWNSGTCTICPAGNACPDPAILSPISCPGGTYAPVAGMKECLKCPGGFKCTGGSAISECSDG